MSNHPSALDFNMSVSDFKRKLDEGTPLVVIDVRNPASFAASKIDASEHVTVFNAPFSEIMSEPGAKDFVDALKSYTARRLGDKLTEDATVVAVCASGNSSVPVTQGLIQLGYDARNLEGGIAAWTNYYDVRTVDAGADAKIYQISRPARGCLSYIVAQGEEAVVIDPLRHTSVYEDTAKEHGLRIVRVLDTHGHADHISGGPALARSLGVPYHLHPYDAIHPMDVLPAAIDYEPLHDGDILRFGTGAALRVMHVPGHTLGQVAFILNESHAFVGDTIFVQSIARPDLGGRGDTWAPIHYESLQRLLALPEDTTFWPGHHSSPGEADDQGLFGRTVKQLRKTNAGLQHLEKGPEVFVRFILDNLPEFPPQYVDIKRVNIGRLRPDGTTAAALETGRNICALSEAYAD